METVQLGNGPRVDLADRQQSHDGGEESSCGCITSRACLGRVGFAQSPDRTEEYTVSTGESSPESGPNRSVELLNWTSAPGPLEPLIP
jgi:hypothetical protein